MMEDLKIQEVNFEGSRCKGPQRAGGGQGWVLKVVGTVRSKSRQKGSGYTWGGGRGSVEGK